MSRLTQLLKRFRLPPETTTADLRKAYFREAKKLHPDHNPSSCGAEAFAQLRADFEEAQKLLEEPRVGYHRHPDGPDFSFEDGKRWSAAAWAAHSQAPPKSRGFRESDFRDPRPEPAVPVVGLPSEVVYTFTAVMSAAIAFGFLYHIYQELSPSRRYCENCQHTVLLRAEGRSPQLREALEGFRKADGVAEVRFKGAVAHRAAAANQVGWLEQCGADKACRPLLFAGDERDDTPLHHCARAGRTEACSALIRLGADPSRLNRFGLAPDHLAAQLGHKETAFVLRSLRASRHGANGGTARLASKRALRHPDDLGHMVPEPSEEAVGTVATESLRFAASISGDPEQALPSLRKQEPSVLPVSRNRSWVESWARGEGSGQPGMLLYEAPRNGGASPGRWVALARQDSGVLRLDPVRGTFFLTDSEAAELAARYPAWSLEPVVPGEENIPKQ